ncbi:MAG: tetratricopeptide repeat protein [Candidatus Obscuribacterales bacterium]
MSKSRRALVLVALVVLGGAGACQSRESVDVEETQQKSLVTSLEERYRKEPGAVYSQLSSALFRLGLIHYRKGEFEKAALEFERSAEVSSKGRGSHCASDYVWPAQCYLKLEKYDQAERYLNLARPLEEKNMSGGISPAMVSILDGLGLVYEKTGRTKEAEQIYREAAEQVEAREADLVQCISSPQAFDALAQFLERQGRLEEAEKWYKQVAGLRVISHAQQAQGESILNYAGLLKRQKRGREAAAMERNGRQIVEAVKRRNEKGLDY